MQHFWWGEEPPTTDDEALVREASSVGVLEPPRTWTRWIAPASSLLSLGFVVFLAVRVAQEIPELPELQRPYGIYAYFDIIVITVILGIANVVVWRKLWYW